jgi:hypothetical protein
VSAGGDMIKKKGTDGKKQVEEITGENTLSQGV